MDVTAWFGPQRKSIRGLVVSLAAASRRMLPQSEQDARHCAIGGICAAAACVAVGHPSAFQDVLNPRGFQLFVPF
ncbi:hypothetical protein AK812_SmicGene47315, partial [Symbiodinium microadriaticum]